MHIIYFYCTDYDFIKTKIIYEKDLNDFLEELSTNDLVRYHILKTLDERLNNILENTQSMQLIYELDYILGDLNLIKTDKNEVNLRKWLISLAKFI